MKRFFFYFIIFISFFIVNICQAQAPETKNGLSVYVGYPTSLNKATLIKNWQGVVDFNLVYCRNLNYNFIYGIGFNLSVVNLTAYNPFSSPVVRNDKFGRLSLTPKIFFGYKISLLNKLVVNPNVDLGFSFLNYTNLNSSEAKIKNTSGFNISPDIQVLYNIDNQFLIGLYLSYHLTFSKVGTPNYFIPELYSVQSDNVMKTLIFGLHFGFLF